MLLIHKLICSLHVCPALVKKSQTLERKTLALLFLLIFCDNDRYDTDFKTCSKLQSTCLTEVSGVRTLLKSFLNIFVKDYNSIHQGFSK